MISVTVARPETTEEKHDMMLMIDEKHSSTSPQSWVPVRAIIRSQLRQEDHHFHMLSKAKFSSFVNQNLQHSEYVYHM